MLIKLCQLVNFKFKNEENIIEIDRDAIVVGDINGIFHDLLRIIKYIKNTDLKVIFLGFYVDRGCFTVEYITLFFTMKVMKQKGYFLLRGNHEFEDMCSYYGFKKK